MSDPACASCLERPHPSPLPGQREATQYARGAFRQLAHRLDNGQLTLRAFASYKHRSFAARAGRLTFRFADTSLAMVFRCAARVTMVVSLCCAIGLHWVALQSFAWATMIIDYSKRAPLCQAIAQTFDGAHPCSLCQVVRTGKNSDKKQDLQSPAPKIDMICVPLANRIECPFAPFEYATGDSFSFEFGHSPPVPPPRSFLS